MAPLAGKLVLVIEAGHPRNMGAEIARRLATMADISRTEAHDRARR